MGRHYLWARKLAGKLDFKEINMKTILLTLHVIVSILLVFSILIQQRGAGLSSTFGGTGNFYATRRGAEKVLITATVVMIFLFVALSVAMLFV